MPIDPYISCPCGSGKKFKWCCASFFAQVEKAFEQDRLGQHDTALQTMRELTHSQADQPAVWGYYAQLLYNLGHVQQTEAERNKLVEQSEEALSQALKLNPAALHWRPRRTRRPSPRPSSRRLPSWGTASL